MPTTKVVTANLLQRVEAKLRERPIWNVHSLNAALGNPPHQDLWRSASRVCLLTCRVEEPDLSAVFSRNLPLDSQGARGETNGFVMAMTLAKTAIRESMLC